MHGGATPRGPEHGAYKHGRYSKWLPKNVLAEAEQAIEHPDFRKATLDLAMLDRFLGQAAAEAERARKPETKQQARDKFADLAIKRSRILSDESRRMLDAADVMSRAKVGTIVAAFAMAVRDVVLSSPHVTDGKQLLAELQMAWRKTSAPMRVNGITVPQGQGQEHADTVAMVARPQEDGVLDVQDRVAD